MQIVYIACSVNITKTPTLICVDIASAHQTAEGHVYDASQMTNLRFLNWNVRYTKKRLRLWAADSGVNLSLSRSWQVITSIWTSLSLFFFIHWGATQHEHHVIQMSNQGFSVQFQQREHLLLHLQSRSTHIGVASLRSNLFGFKCWISFFSAPQRVKCSGHVFFQVWLMFTFLTTYKRSQSWHRDKVSTEKKKKEDVLFDHI